MCKRAECAVLQIMKTSKIHSNLNLESKPWIMETSLWEVTNTFHPSSLLIYLQLILLYGLSASSIAGFFSFALPFPLKPRPPEEKHFFLPPAISCNKNVHAEAADLPSLSHDTGLLLVQIVTPEAQLAAECLDWNKNRKLKERLLSRPRNNRRRLTSWEYMYFWLLFFFLLVDNDKPSDLITPT